MESTTNMNKQPTFSINNQLSVNSKQWKQQQAMNKQQTMESTTYNE